MGIICLPYLLLPHKFLRKPVNIWIIGIFKLLQIICNITYEIKGKEKIPSKEVIIASKHQSAFETFALFLNFNNTIFIHKKQLFFIPIFGQYLKKINMISINRSEGFSSMRKILKETKKRLSNGNSIVIFPEGTRKKPGEKPNYKSGIIGIYKESEVQILPIALNSGNFWPKHTIIKKPGHIIIKILDPIPAKLKSSLVLQRIKTTIEEETNKII